ETGTCPSVAGLTGDPRLVLSAALRRELVRHVDDCPRCRRTAERAVAGSWPGTSVTPDALPVLQAPKAALRTAMAHAPRARGGGMPHFDRRGFPMDPKDHAARRDRLRARAVTTTVVAAVIAAPVLAMWAAYRGAPLTGEATDGRTATTHEAHGPDGLDREGAGGYENAGNVRTGPDPRLDRNSHAPDVSVEVIGGKPGTRGEGLLAVSAAHDGTTTLVTLMASGDSPVHWSVSTGAAWLYPSQSSGTLAPGESFTVRVYVDHLREPTGVWHARLAVAPAGAVVSIDGYGPAAPSNPRPTPTRSVSSPPASSRPPTTSPDPTPGDPTPTDPTPTSPPSSDPPSSTPTPTGSATPSPSS
ncbi:MAG: hypothetical protein LBV60_17345, partial [Streptomyces sp.]|nr:hypothetical protein [Streptomyces sp.]